MACQANFAGLGLEFNGFGLRETFYFGSLLWYFLDKIHKIQNLSPLGDELKLLTTIAGEQFYGLLTVGKSMPKRLIKSKNIKQEIYVKHILYGYMYICISS